MTNMTKDYYKILGVSQNCTEQELKSAYRKLARKFHPDVAGDSSEVVSKFKEINEAYEILSDKVKRAEYDTINRFYNYSSTKQKDENKQKTASAPNDFKKNRNETKKEEQKSSNFNFKWEDFISKYREFSKDIKEDTKAQYGNVKRGKDINTDVEITITEAINGTQKVINMLQTQVCPKCHGRRFVNGSICPHCKGKGDISDYRRFSVKIPAGIKNNSKIRLAGEGEKGLNGGANGDLYITVHVQSPVDYTTDGNNILKTITLAPFEAVLGGNVSIKTFDGNVTVKIAPNTQNGQKIRLSGCGVNKNGKVGDMILIVEIQIPKNLTPQEVELYKKLQDISSQSVR